MFVLLGLTAASIGQPLRDHQELLTRISGTIMLGMALFTPLGFILDPLFDKIGAALLNAAGLREFWTTLYNVPLVPFTNFNNTVTLGSFVFWVATAVPIYFLGKWAIRRYRETYGQRVMNSKLFKGIKASKVYNVYTWFKPE